jgi:pyruvate dehydrogenase E2 component (dihydrolipoamide acetyltransferase)
MSLDATEDGFLAKIIVGEGAKDVPINTTIAILVPKKDDVSKFANYSESEGSSKSEKQEKQPSQAPPPSSPSSSSSSSPKGSSQQPQQDSKPSSPSKSYPPHSVIGLPSLSPSMETGNLLAWKKKEGDQIKQGDIIAQIETDKSAMDFETTEEGYIAKLLCTDNTKDIPINTPIAIVVSKKSDVEAFKDFTPQKKAQQAQQEQPKQTQTQEKQEKQEKPQQGGRQTAASEGGRVVASPLARALGREHGVDLSQIRGTGPSNRIIKDDVLEFVAEQKTQPKKEAEPQREAAKPSKAAQPSASDNYTDIPVSNIRKVTAERLLHSKQTIPHYYLTMEVRVDKLLKLRAELNDQSNGKYKLSVNDFIIKASALALQKVPAVNSSWNDKFIRKYNNIDINVAVNTDQGLFTPIVHGADKRGLSDIANTVKTLAEKAKAGKLSPPEFQGGTFTISNLGMFGIKHFAAVINPPQAAILAVGGATQRLVPASAGGDATEVANVLTVTLSCDHRVIDGAVGAEWLQAFKDVLENPIKLLL